MKRAILTTVALLAIFALVNNGYDDLALVVSIIAVVCAA